ncbi:hypothetical protein ID866_6820 [Astraeus odoratus]|nr:hypothetical protein ID866_6820 [Astraeus odoratus]
MSDIIAEIRKIPLVTRTLVCSSLAITLSTSTSLVHWYYVVFISQPIFQNFQLWRPYTSMLLGRGNLNYIFELAALYQYSNSLESTYYTGRSSDYAWQLSFASLSIILANRPLGSVIHFRALLHTLTYLSCSLAPPGARSTIMGLITVPVTYVPYAMLAIDILVDVGSAGTAVSGMVIGHLWWWLIWGAGTGAGGTEQGLLASYARAPRWLRDFFGERDTVRGSHHAGYHVVPPRGQDSSARSTGHRWGAGQRLGR